MSRAAEALHVNYYKRTEFLNADLIREDVNDVENMLDVLEPFIT